MTAAAKSPLWVPGAAQTGPQSDKNAGAIGLGGWLEPVVRRVVLLKVNASGTQRLTASVAARIQNPATRLVCSFSISFEPETPQPFSNFNSSVWSAQAIREGTVEGREAQLHSIFSSQTLPQLYEISTGVRAIDVTATLAIPLTAGAAAIPGSWVLESQWEPAIPMCAEELATLYAKCLAKQTLVAAGPLAP
jgi:hypothetical protein